MDDSSDNRVAEALGLLPAELDFVSWDLDVNQSEDGLIYNYIVNFSEDSDPKILERIGVNNFTTELDLNVFETPGDYDQELYKNTNNNSEEQYAERGSVIEGVATEKFKYDRFLPEDQLEELQNDLETPLWINSQYYIALTNRLSESSQSTTELFLTILAVPTLRNPEIIVDSFYSKLSSADPNFPDDYLVVKKNQASTIRWDDYNPDITVNTDQVIEALKTASALTSELNHEDSNTLSPHHILAGLLMKPGESLNNFFEKSNISQKRFLKLLIESVSGLGYSDNEMAIWYRFTEPVTGNLFPRQTSGFKSDFSRDGGGDTLTKETDTYSAAIVHALRNSDNKDVSFAIFGPWGRGKTTLVDKIRENLKGDQSSSLRYATVTFNAWKYPNRPEVWLHLYEEVKKEATGENFLKTARLAIQSKLSLDKGWPLLLPSLILLLAAFSSIQKLEVFIWLFPGFTILSGLLLLKYWGVFTSKTLPILQSYIKLPDHSANLGLQSTVGEEFKRLLVTWTDQRKFRERMVNFFPYSLSILAIGFSSLFLWWKLREKISCMPEIFLWAFSSIIFILGIYGLYSGKIKRPDKVLLVVDDLDRCEPGQMLTVIESIRVFLDDPEISNRLQVAMLVDKHILNLAILEKYSSLFVENQEKSKVLPMRFDPDALLNEQLEKLFLFRFTLPDFDQVELYDVATKILEISEVSPTKSKNAEGITVTAIESVKVATESLSNRPQIPDAPKSTSEQQPLETHDILDKAIELSNAEKKSLRDLILNVAAHEKQPITPRRIRSIRMQYFFGRYLMISLYGDDAPLKELREALKPGSESKNFDERVRKILLLID